MSKVLRFGEKGIEVKRLQELLNFILSPSPKLVVDGDFGRNTLIAVKRYQAQQALGIDGIVGPKTWKSLSTKKDAKKPEPVIPVVIDSNSSWMKIARQELGQTEIAGKEHNPRIIKYHASTTLKAKSDEVPWCSSFVNWVLVTAKITGTNSASAASWLDWGEKSSAKNGAIVVIRNAKAANSSLTASGNHVGFLVKETATHYVLLGGNQSDQVKISNFPKASWTLRGYRWPKG